MTTVQLSMGNTTEYATRIALWSAGFAAKPDAEKRLENTLGRLTLTVLRKRGDNKGLNCEEDPDNRQWHVLHFQLADDRWLCLRVTSEPGDTAKLLTFDVCDSNGKDPTAQRVTLTSDMGLQEMWNRIENL